MLILFRWFLRLFKKEHALLNRYERSHPHFIRYIAIDAVISVAVVVGAYQLISTNSSKAQSSVQMGVTAVSSGELLSAAKSGNIDAFWLGPVAGYKYTLNDQELRIVDIFYWPGDTGSRDAKQFLYEVKTYESQDVWDTHTHPILAKVNISTIAVTPDISIRINRTSMKGVIVTYGDKPEIVAIAYPAPQTLDGMIKNVESLKLVR